MMDKVPRKQARNKDIAILALQVSNSFSLLNFDSTVQNLKKHCTHKQHAVIIHCIIKRDGTTRNCSILFQMKKKVDRFRSNQSNLTSEHDADSNLRPREREQ